MSLELFTIGLITGTTYATIGLGLLLIYRLSGTINLAQGEIGALGAAVAALLSVGYGWPFPVAVVVGIAAAAALGGIAELVVVKRLGGRPAVVMMVATLGIGQLAAMLRLSLPDLPVVERFPRLFDTNVSLGAVELSGPEVAALVIAPVLTFLVWWVMARTTAGAVVRATAANPEATRLAGINAAWVSTAVWIAAGALAAVATITAVPLRGGSVASIATVGPGLLLRGFAAALVGRMRSIPLTLVGGLALGVAEAWVISSTDDPGTASLIVFGAVLVGLAVLPSGLNVDTSRVVAVVRPWSDWPAGARRTVARVAPGILAAVIVLALPFVVTSAGYTFQLSRLVVLFLVVVSASVLAGWSGQLSLAQFALAGLGAIVSARLVAEGGSWETSLLAAAATTALAAAALAIPTSRLRGSLLGIATLGFAIVAPSWLFEQGFAGDVQVFRVPRVDFGIFELRPQRAYYFFTLAVAAVVCTLLAAIGRRASARRWRAVKDNERAAAAFGVSNWRSRLGAFLVAGAVAGLAGGLLGGLMVSFERGAFGAEESIDVVVMAVIGGLGSIAGAALGVVWADGLVAFFPDLEGLQLLVSGVGLLVILIYFPDGLASIVRKGQELLAGPRRASDGDDPAARLPLDEVIGQLGAGGRPGGDAPPAPELAVEGVTVTFGSRAVVDHVGFDVRPGSIVGLIGPNGAGKTSLLNALSGLQPAAGTVALDGRDVSGWPADRRARNGIGRTFQDARLFPSMTVRDAIRVAAATCERRSILLDAVVPGRLRRTEARIADRADAVIELTGLGRYADEQCAVLSTGTRRVVELACLVAGGGRLLLLDEPTAGLAQREVEAFPPILRALRDHLDATIVIVEHDIAMLAVVCDRLICMEAGAVIADGAPDAVRHDPAVVESYLGPNLVAVDRTGSGT